MGDSGIGERLLCVCWGDFVILGEIHLFIVALSDGFILGLIKDFGWGDIGFSIVSWIFILIFSSMFIILSSDS